MTSKDARFEDAGHNLVSLVARDPEDLQVISAFVQDAVFPANEVVWKKTERCFALLINRFRWEAETTPPERVQSLLIIKDVQSVVQNGVDNASDVVLSMLSMTFTAGEDGTGVITIQLAGDGEIRLNVECIEINLRDVTRPYTAPSRKMPSHPE